jgi:hypothetical protein
MAKLKKYWEAGDRVFMHFGNGEPFNGRVATVTKFNKSKNGGSYSVIFDDKCVQEHFERYYDEKVNVYSVWNPAGMSELSDTTKQRLIEINGINCFGEQRESVLNPSLKLVDLITQYPDLEVVYHFDCKDLNYCLNFNIESVTVEWMYKPKINYWFLTIQNEMLLDGSDRPLTDREIEDAKEEYENAYGWSFAYPFTTVRKEYVMSKEVIRVVMKEIK